MTPPPALRFTEADVDAAYREWCCNCGPAALAAVLGVTLDVVRGHMPDFEHKGYTNPTLMWAALDRAGAIFKTTTHKPGAMVRPLRPAFGLARVQWDGPWCRDGVPARAAYRHTHWIGVCEGRDSIGVFDVNCMKSGGWVRYEDWALTIVPHLLATVVPRATGGFWMTHTVEMARAVESPS